MLISIHVILILLLFISFWTFVVTAGIRTEIDVLNRRIEEDRIIKINEKEVDLESRMRNIQKMKFSSMGTQIQLLSTKEEKK